jgi:FkbM family methyltransferase
VSTHNSNGATLREAVAGARTFARSFAPPVYYFVKWVRYCLRYDRYVQSSYSQEGEDLILARIFATEYRGFYVDIGAHHPKRLSNTFLLHRRGWRGINIDAMPGSMRAFQKHRADDINLEIPILKARASVNYYRFNEPALNGFSRELSESRDGHEGYKIVGVSELEGFPLRDVLQEHMPLRQVIDFMTVDVEGLDFDVLQSNDWTRFRPKVVLVELLRSSLSHVADDPVHRFLTSVRYQLFAKTSQTVFYISDEYARERAAAE